MKISMDKKYRTRDGRDVRLLCVDGTGEYPVVGLVSGGDTPEIWTSYGWRYLTKIPSDFDLIEYHEPDIRTIYVNVYSDCMSSWSTKEMAERQSSLECIAIAQPVTFKVKRS